MGSNLSGRRPGPRRRIGGLILATVLGLTVVALAARWLASPAGRDWRLGARLYWATHVESRRPAALKPLFQESLMRSMAAAGIDTALVRTEWRQGSGASAAARATGATLRARWEVPLPEGFGTSRGNASVTPVVERFGGRILDGVEEPGNRVLVTAEVAPGLEAEILLMGKEKPQGGAPRLALLVDRFGFRNLAEAEALLDIGQGLSVAILPYTTGARDLADRCRARGMEVLLNLPMEGLDYPRIDPGPDAILVDTPPREIQKRVLKALDEIGGATGVNTFLGALAVEDPNVMQAVLKAVGSRGAYFVDSTPSTFSVVRRVAAEVGVASIRLGNSLDAPGASAAAIRRNLVDLAERAMTRGSAVGLIHPYPGTVEALRTLMPEWKRRGLELVPMSEIVTVPAE